VERGCAFIGQSGSLCHAVTRNHRSAPLAYVISCGNQSVLEIADYMDVLVDHPAITCFALFIEGLTDVTRFSRIALRALEAGKPIIALKSGVSDLGAKMAMSHTSSLAGDDDHYQALFDRLGIIRVTTPVELLETAKFITYTGVPKGRRIVGFTCSGGDNEMIADLTAPFGLELPQPTPAQREAIKEHMQLYTSISNPLDYNTTNWGKYDVLVKLFTAALSENADLGFAVFEHSHDPNLQLGARETLEAVRDAGKATGVPVVHACLFSENSNQHDRDEMHGEGMAMLQGMREGVGAIGKTILYGERRSEVMARTSPDDLMLAPLTSLTDDARALNEWQGKQALKAYGLPVPDGRAVDVASAAAAAEEIGLPVALKVLSETILHKTDVGGVALNLTTTEAVAAAASDMAARLGVDQVLVEPMAPKPVAELIIGITRSDLFGPVLVIGAGGILVELYKDAACLLLPAHENDVRAAIAGLKIARLLDGFRGGPKGDIDALVEAVMAVARYAQDHRDSLAELDINPLFVLPEGHGVVAVDALIRKA
ncbi:MAG: acetate--CoA ligase family protein, partial [Rhodospirillaceae bacterium]|nr:acetate--CoA ligase family protein [Rhodospirillaceae bacterium]